MLTGGSRSRPAQGQPCERPFIVYGVEASSFEAGAAISQRVASALGWLADTAWREARELAAAVG